jgi:hypothetical protein
MDSDSIKMTRADLYDWVCSHGCEITPLSENKAKVIMIENPKNNRKTWIGLPIDNSIVRDYTIYKTCNDLGIQIPTHTTYLKVHSSF